MASNAPPKVPGGVAEDNKDVNVEPPQPPQWCGTRRVIFFTTAIAVLLGCGFLAGWYSMKATVDDRCAVDARAAAQKSWAPLPPFGSAAAADLANDPSTAPGIKAVYQAADDAANIPAETVDAFLVQLQGQLQGQLPGFMSVMELTAFRDLANTLVDMARVARATSFLKLLRAFATQNTEQQDGVVWDQVDSDVVQRELKSLLQPSALDGYFRYMTARDVVDLPGSARDWQAVFALPPSSPAPGGRKLLGHPEAAAAAAPGEQQVAHRRLQDASLAASAVMPAIQGGVTGVGSRNPVIPTQLPRQTLQDMLCAIGPWAANPRNLTGCPKRPPGQFSFNGTAFKNVTIPVIFHCMNYMDDTGRQQPAYWDGTGAGKHLIAATNKLFCGSGIRFKLKEVRSNPLLYPYLTVNGSVADWNACGASKASFDKDQFGCLKDIVKMNGDRDLSINVVVTGSTFSQAHCDTSDVTAVCNQLFLGYSSAAGPWMASPSATWSEGNLEENWVYLPYDYFSQDEKNNEDRWDGGAATLAHMLGHYLGLQHTFQGGCSGDGLQQGDGVPDTPMNKDILEYTAQQKMKISDLAMFCANWRRGRPYNVRALEAFSSCPRGTNTSAVVDNLFNIASYVPDACAMVFTPNQVARMQWSIANHRPQLMAQHGSSKSHASETCNPRAPVC